jgi:hypothetical protein
LPWIGVTRLILALNKWEEVYISPEFRSEYTLIFHIFILTLTPMCDLDLGHRHLNFACNTHFSNGHIKAFEKWKKKSILGAIWVFTEPIYNVYATCQSDPGIVINMQPLIKLKNQYNYIQPQLQQVTYIKTK